MNALTIVPATLEHLETLVPLFDAYRVFYGYPSDEAAARSYLRERIARAQSVLFLALDADGSGLGFTQLYPTFSSTQLKNIWILNDLFVTPEARQGGVARALMEQARQLAIRTNAAELMLSTAVDNVKAQALYELLGYVRDTQFLTYTLTLPTE